MTCSECPELGAPSSRRLASRDIDWHQCPYTSVYSLSTKSESCENKSPNVFRTELSKSFRDTLPCSLQTKRISKSRPWHVHCFSIVALSARIFTIVGLQGCERTWPPEEEDEEEEEEEEEEDRRRSKQKLWEDFQGLDHGEAGIDHGLDHSPIEFANAEGVQCRLRDNQCRRAQQAILNKLVTLEGTF